MYQSNVTYKSTLNPNYNKSTQLERPDHPLAQDCITARLELKSTTQVLAKLSIEDRRITKAKKIEKKKNIQ